MYFKTRSLVASFIALTLILPVNVYIIGGSIGAGLQFPFLRYQETYLGTNVITILRDLDYVTSGIITGRSALSILLWALGAALLTTAIIYLIARREDVYETLRKPLALLTAGGAAAYLLSCIAQYGPTLHGPAGFTVPVGVPLILAVAGYILKVEEDDKPGCEGGERDYGGEVEEEQ